MRIDLSKKHIPQVVIVANGTLEKSLRVKELLEEAQHILLCDGALNSYTSTYKRRPDAVIGDGDSVCQRALDSYGITLTKVPDQETNDLTKAVNYALEKGWKDICILGGTGKREDHTIGNIALLAEYHKLGATVRMITEFGIMLPFRGVLQVVVIPLQQLSLFSLSSAPMSARGVAYPFEGRTFNALWEATLNYAVEEVVEVESEEVSLIYIANEVRKEE